MIKRFFEWIELKINVDEIPEQKLPLFTEGEIWWCSIGENVGTEINGKSEYFTRPVLIFKKFGKESFFALPLSTKNRFGSWYSSITFENISQTVVLNQGRTLSARRLRSRIGELSYLHLSTIKADFHRLYL